MTIVDHRGFTLIEMLVIMVLVAISIAVVYPNLHLMREKFDLLIEKSTSERAHKKEAFTRFIADDLPQIQHH